MMIEKIWYKYVQIMSQNNMVGSFRTLKVN